MHPQPPSSNQSNDFVVLVALVSGIYASVALWEPVKPLVVKFLYAYQNSLGQEMARFLYLISPLALYALVVALIIGVLEGLLFPMLRQFFAEWSFGRMKDRLGKSSEGPGFFAILCIVIFILGLIGELRRSL